MSTVERVLAQYPGPITLYPSKRKWLALLLISVLFALAGFWMVQTNTKDGWGVLVFFGCGIPISLIAMIPSLNYLSLDQKGFNFRMFYRAHSIKWTDASRFSAAFSNAMVVFDDRNVKRPALGKLNQALVDRNSGLSDTYGLPAQDLADLMTRWRQKSRGIRQRNGCAGKNRMNLRGQVLRRAPLLWMLLATLCVLMIPGAASGQVAFDNARYAKLVAGHLKKQLNFFLNQYPRASSGIVRVNFTLGPGGNVLRAKVTQTSGSAELDALALGVVQRAVPFPAADDGTNHPFAVPISFVRRADRKLVR